MKYLVIGGPEKFTKELVDWDPSSIAMRVPNLTGGLPYMATFDTESYRPHNLVIFGKDIVVWLHSSLDFLDERAKNTALINGMTNDLFKESWMQAPWTRA